MNNAPDPERDSAAVQDFMSKMEAAFRAHSLWAGCSEEELDSAGEVSSALPLIASLYVVICCAINKVSYCVFCFVEKMNTCASTVSRKDSLSWLKHHTT